MMDDLIARMNAAPALTALVASRIHANVRPQGGERPAVILRVISDVTDHAMSGPTNYRQTRVQAECYAATYASAQAVRTAMRAALDGWAGTQGSTQFHGIFAEGERDDFLAGTNEPDRHHRTQLDLMIHHRSL